MMTDADVARVLTHAAAFDQRTIGAADVAAWAEVIGDLELDDCLEAVAAHFGSSQDRLMPFHVRRGAVARAQARYAARLEQVVHVDPDDPAAWREAVADERRRLASPNPDTPPLELQ